MHITAEEIYELNFTQHQRTMGLTSKVLNATFHGFKDAKPSFFRDRSDTRSQAQLSQRVNSKRKSMGGTSLA